MSSSSAETPIEVDDVLEALRDRRPRQARALETRAKLTDAGRAAFARYGVDGTNLAEDVLKPAGVSVGSFYHQFADKTELLLEVIATGIDARHALIDAGIAADHATLDEMVRTGLERFFDSLDEHRDAWLVQLAEQHHTDPRAQALVVAGRRRWIDSIARELHRFSDADDDAIASAATALVGFATGTANVYLALPARDRRASRSKTLEGAVTFATAGVRALIG